MNCDARTRCCELISTCINKIIRKYKLTDSKSITDNNQGCFSVCAAIVSLAVDFHRLFDVRALETIPYHTVDPREVSNMLVQCLINNVVKRLCSFS